MAEAKFVTALNCMDGRVQEPVVKWMKEYGNADYVDMITEPGLDKLLCEGSETIKNLIKDKITISIEKHDSNLVAIAGHYDCAGNPCDKDEHFRHVQECVKVVKEWFPMVEVIGIWVNENWEVEKLEF